MCNGSCWGSSLSQGEAVMRRCLHLLVLFTLLVSSSVLTAAAQEVTPGGEPADSGGLGLTVDEWRAVYGEPIDTQFDEALDRYPGDGGYDVDIRFLMNPTDRM